MNMKTSHVIIIIIALAIWAFCVRWWVAYSKVLDQIEKEKEDEVVLKNGGEELFNESLL